MKIEPIKFKEFGASVAIMSTKSAKTFLPGGRMRGAVPPPPPLTFNEEQLKAAEREAYKKGFLEGTEEGRKLQDSEQAATERKLLTTAETFTQHLVPLVANWRETLLNVKNTLPKLALAMAKKAAGPALDANAQAAVEDMAVRGVSALLSEPKLTITVHESLAAALEAKLKALAEKNHAKCEMTVARDANMPLADCKITWDHGTMARDTEQLWKDLEHAAGNIASAGQHAAKDQLDNVEKQVLESPPTENK